MTLYIYAMTLYILIHLLPLHHFIFSFSINKTNGAIQERIFLENFGKGSNVVPDRQADAHAHMVFLVNNFIYVVDLGSDKIHHYKVIRTLNL